MPKIEKSKEFHHFPFGCLAIAAPLEKLGIKYDIFDERVTDENAIIERLGEYAIVAVSMFTGYQTFRGHYWLKTIRACNPRAVTIVGGPHVSALPEETARSPLVDFAVAGYGENPFINLVVHLLSGKDIASVGQMNFPGVYSKHGAGVFGLPAPKTYKIHRDIEWNPLPYRRLNIQSYLNPKTRRVMYVSQYGCPGRCTFCATPGTRKWTSKPLEIVYQDLETLDQLTEFRQICFFDATLFTNRKRTMELVAHLDSRFPGRQWLADARAAELIHYTDDDLAAIKRCRAELIMLVVGLETGSVRLAEDVVKKGRGHLQNFYEVARRAHTAGIKITSGVVFGFPGETLEDLQQTTDYVREIRKIHPDFRISTTFFRALPGTELYDQVRAMGHVTASSLEEWAELGSGNHYEYNKWSDPPWMTRSEIDRYQEGYQRFVDEHGAIMI